MSLLLCFYMSSNSTSNKIIEEEIKHHDISDEEEIGNGNDLKVEGYSEINAFEEAKIEAI